MKKVMLTTILLLSAAQAENIVHYDIRDTGKSAISKPNHPTTDTKKSAISKPNHPTTDLYSKK